jgi:AcrR family transcriptional regulator
LTLVPEAIKQEVNSINPERKQREHLARQDEIVGIAAQLFSRKGYFATRMDDIAEQAQYSKAALYRYFASKEEIYGQVLLHGLETLQDRLEAAQSEAAGELSGVELVWLNLQAFYRESPELLEALALLQHHDIRQALSPELLGRIEQLGAGNFRLIGKLITQRGESAEAVRLAQAVWSAFTGTVQLALSQRHIGHDPDDQSALFAATYELVAAGLTTSMNPP